MSIAIQILLVTVALIPTIACLALLYDRATREGGFGVRTIHKIVGLLLVPMIALFAVEGILLEQPIVAALVGALVGYVFAEIAYTD